MSFPDATTLAPAYGAKTQNKLVGGGSAVNLTRNGWFVGSYDPAKTDVVDDIPKQYLSSNQVGAELGWGFPLHRMAKRWEKYGTGVNLWVTPQAEIAEGVQAAGSITVTVTTAVAGTIPLYIGGDLVEVPVTAGQTVDSISAAITAAITADRDLPVTSISTLGVAALTAKAKGTYGNFISIAACLQGQSLPDGVSLAIVDMVGGATDPDVDDALEGNGTGDNINQIYATDAVVQYQPTQSNLTKISNWNGVGDEAIGCWAPNVNRMVRFFNCNTVAGSAGYTAMKVITDANLLDRTNSYIGVPDAYDHPQELAAEIAGACASINQANSHVSYVGVPLTCFFGTDRWTDSGASRDTAIKTGIGTTRVKNGSLVIDGLITMYRPDTVASNKNAWRSMRNLSIIQNALKIHKDIWAAKPSFTIVEDISLVNPAEKPFVMDEDSAKDINNAYALTLAKKAMIWNATYMQENQTVTIREANNGFDMYLPMIFSIEGVVSNTLIYTGSDVSIVN